MWRAKMSEDSYYTAEVARCRSVKNGDWDGRIQRKIWDTNIDQYTRKVGNKWIMFDLGKDSPALIEQEITGSKVLNEEVWREWERRN